MIELANQIRIQSQPGPFYQKLLEPFFQHPYNKKRLPEVDTEESTDETRIQLCVVCNLPVLNSVGQ